MALFELCHRYAALLEAGLPLREVDAQLGADRDQLNDGEEQRLSRMVSFGRDLGIPLADLMRSWAAQLEQQAEQGRQLESAFAAPRATAFLVTGLPVLSIAMAQLAGLNPLAALAGSRLAQLSAIVGTFFLVLGWLVMRRMMTRAKPDGRDAGELLALFAQSLLSGLPTKTCFELTCLHLGLGGEPLGDRELEWQFAESRRLMDYSLTTGSSLRDLLIAQASVRRSQSFAAQRSTIERLGVRLMIPLGLVVLPAFVLIGVVPVTVGMLAK